MSDMTTQVHCKNYINGEFRAANSGETYENRCPADIRQLLGTAPNSDTSDVADAVAAAKEAFKSWKQTTGPARGEIVFRLVE
jgi:acyl-CoA reductase-like NAD-dependent aldehyde dehydrogenase